MEEEYQNMREQNLAVIIAKLSLIRFFGFELKPFSLGVAVRYIQDRKHWDQFYLQENELVLLTFLDYVLDYNLPAGKLLQEKNPLQYNIANEILYRETSEPIAEWQNWQALLISLDYIVRRNEDNLKLLLSHHRDGEHIMHYLIFVMTKSDASRKYLADKHYYSLAFAESLIYNSKKHQRSLVLDYKRK